MMLKIVALAVALMFASQAAGDVLQDADRLLCVPGPVFHCVVNDGCSTELPEEEFIPQFIEVDLKQKTLSTTRASGEDRSTPIQHQVRDAGNIYLQGVENGRTFSMVISENTGDLTFTVAADGETASMFGNCTPD